MADTPEFPKALRLPDVVSEVAPSVQGALSWVGMERIELVLTLAGAALPARGSAFVNLVGEHHRGIHMSRLYRTLDQHLSAHEPAPAALRAMLQEFLDSHAGLSDRARVGLEFELPLRRPALKSGLTGWRLYPVRLGAQLDAQGFQAETTVDVLYSSTCPGSAALSRQLVEQGLLATPHAQRSIATVSVRWDNGDIAALIDAIEQALATPVQTAVRREDEQEFARLNGENPMYCEDAVRRIRAALESFAGVADYRVRAAHLESLHPHDAVAMAVKGIVGGYAP